MRSRSKSGQWQDSIVSTVDSGHLRNIVLNDVLDVVSFLFVLNQISCHQKIKMAQITWF